MLKHVNITFAIEKLMFRLNEWRRACIKVMTIGWDAATITRRKINEKFLKK